MKKKIMSLSLVLAMFLSLLPSAYADNSPFTDVPANHWAYNEIIEAYNDGVMTGTATQTFSPDGKLDMAQFTTILARAFYKDELGTAGPGDNWWDPAYKIAYHDNHNLFGEVHNIAGNTQTTREVMAEMMYRVMVDKGAALPSETGIQATMSKIPDISSVNSEFRTGVAVCYNLGLLAGVDAQGTFSPKGILNRAETAVIYTRLKKAINSPGTETSAPGTTNPGTTQTPSNGMLTNGQPITEANVAALLEEYKNGKTTTWPAVIEAGITSFVPGSPYNWRTTYHSTLDAEYGPKEERTQVNLAFVISDELFGNAPMRQLNDFSEIRPGDLLYMGGDYWSFAAARPVEKDGWLYVTTIGHAYDGTISWHDGDIGRVCLNSNYKGAYTRYPEGTATSPITTVSSPSIPGSTSNTSRDDFSEEYKSSKYYRQLQEVVLTGDYRKDILAVAASQIGYSEGNKENQINGSYGGRGDYTEYGRYLGSNGSAWCSEFASWCARMANIPTDILKNSRSANVSNFGAPYYTWSETVYAGGSYTPRPGDLALFAWSGTSKTASSLSHTAIVSSVQVSGNTVTITVIDGNSNSTVCMHDYTAKASDGNVGKGYLVYFVAPDYD